jgi:PAS domain-containing protein
MPAGAGKTGPKAFPRVAMDLATTVERIQQNFVISDPTLPDCPIVFASDAFLELTEYSREEVLGRNCRFLQVGRLGGGRQRATRQWERRHATSISVGMSNLWCSA